jgi:hypothetical protein
MMKNWSVEICITLDTVKPALKGPFIKRNLSSTEIFSGPVTLGLKKMLNNLD